MKDEKEIRTDDCLNSMSIYKADCTLKKHQQKKFIYLPRDPVLEISNT